MVKSEACAVENKKGPGTSRARFPIGLTPVVLGFRCYQLATLSSHVFDHAKYMESRLAARAALQEL